MLILALPFVLYVKSHKKIETAFIMIVSRIRFKEKEKSRFLLPLKCFALCSL